MNDQADLTGYTASFADGLYQAGINKIVISPGSRSTPLAMMFHAHPEIETWINVDERSAAFFALGMAKGLQEPVALLCSSGTASANYYPAIIEARYSRVPLVVLTADRPHELREVGAPQTIDQIKMYGDHVKYHQDMPIPENDETIFPFLRASARRAVARAKQAPQGPVHLNFPFREPLVPDVNRRELWQATDRSKNQVVLGQPCVNEARMNDLVMEWDNIEKPLIVVGPQQDQNLISAVIELAETLQAPIIADPLSGLRAGRFDKSSIIDGYDAFLRSSLFADTYQTDFVLRFGAMPVSKPFLKYLGKAKPKHYLVIDESGVWREPTHLASQMIQSDPVFFCNSLTKVLANKKQIIHTSTNWLSHWQKVNAVTTQVLSRFVEESVWFEGHVVDILLKHIEEETAIFAGNSMPIRDIDTFLLNRENPVSVYANRGANGIDGVVSTALGVSTVKKPLVLLIGDLSFFHDMNGLMAAKLYNLDILVIVVNNNGGGIFSFLSQAKENEQTFEALFGTPLDLDIEAVARLYKATYRQASDKLSFEKALLELQGFKGLKIIEAVTSRNENTAIHQSLWAEIIRAVEDGMK
ncbi:MAG: 2-succinyl-5-enolpyruvyl-6-hydroxy-3-cyclohexene-1-carboxylic-acid synthase [Tuberibacillus sp.]